jgi:hypothetical protein
LPSELLSACVEGFVEVILASRSAALVWVVHVAVFWGGEFTKCV